MLEKLYNFPFKQNKLRFGENSSNNSDFSKDSTEKEKKISPLKTSLALGFIISNCYIASLAIDEFIPLKKTEELNKPKSKGLKYFAKLYSFFFAVTGVLIYLGEKKEQSNNNGSYSSKEKSYKI